METFKNVQDLMMQSDFMTSIDLRDAYFSIPIHEDHHRFLGFSWEKAYYCFQCLPFGLSSAPRVFTKVFETGDGRYKMQGHSFYDLFG